MYVPNTLYKCTYVANSVQHVLIVQKRRPSKTFASCQSRSLKTSIVVLLGLQSSTFVARRTLRPSLTFARAKAFAVEDIALAKYVTAFAVTHSASKRFVIISFTLLVKTISITPWDCHVTTETET